MNEWGCDHAGNTPCEECGKYKGKEQYCCNPSQAYSLESFCHNANFTSMNNESQCVTRKKTGTNGFFH